MNEQRWTVDDGMLFYDGVVDAFSSGYEALMAAVRLVGDPEAGGDQWAGCDRAEAIRQAEQTHAEVLRLHQAIAILHDKINAAEADADTLRQAREVAALIQRLPNDYTPEGRLLDLLAPPDPGDQP